MFANAGKSMPKVIVPLSTGIEEITGLADLARALEDLGVTRIPLVMPYKDNDEFQRIVDGVAALAAQLDAVQEICPFLNHFRLAVGDMSREFANP